MKDCHWNLILLCFTSMSLALAIDPSVWTPNCAGAPDKTFVAHPSDCRKYFLCLQGIPYRLSCPLGQMWNPDLKECSIVSNCGKQLIDDIPLYNPQCPQDEDPKNPKYLPNNYDCERFFECRGGLAFPMVCPEEKHWSIEYNSCMDISVANCIDPQKTIVNGQLNDECPFNDDLNNPTHFPHPGDCTKFLKCSFGRSFIVSCPFGLHWDIDTSRCESPLIAQCKKKKNTSVSPTIKKTTTSRPISTGRPVSNVPVCPKNGVKNFGIPGQCDKYFSCSQGKLYITTCRTGRQWSEKVSGCADSKVAKCTGLINTQKMTTGTNSPLNKPISSLTTQRQQSAPRPTSCAPGIGFLSHPTDCHKFYVCDNGKPVEMSCPGRLYFSNSTSSCQWTNIEC